MPFGALAPLPLRLGGSSTEGWSPSQHARLCADLVAVKRTARLCRLYVNQDLTGPYAASVTAYTGQNGAGLAYAPSVTVNGAGDVTLTFASYWEDDFGVQSPVKLRQAIARGYATACRLCTTVISGATIRIRTFDASGSAAAAPFSLRVW